MLRFLLLVKNRPFQTVSYTNNYYLLRFYVSYRDIRYKGNGLCHCYSDLSTPLRYYCRLSTNQDGGYLYFVFNYLQRNYEYNLNHLHSIFLSNSLY